MTTRHEDVPSVAVATAVAAAVPVSSSFDVLSPGKSDGMSVSMDETMSSCDSFKSPDIEYVDNTDVSAVDSIQRKTFCSLNISDTKHYPEAGLILSLVHEAIIVKNV